MERIARAQGKTWITDEPGRVLEMAASDRGDLH